MELFLGEEWVIGVVSEMELFLGEEMEMQENNGEVNGVIGEEMDSKTLLEKSMKLV